MSGLAYGGALLASLVGTGLLDRRFRLFLFADARRALAVLGVGLAFLLLWDLGGIGLGVFHRGESRWMSGVELAPDLPVEEVGFLVLLCYVTMTLYAAALRLLGRREAGA